MSNSKINVWKTRDWSIFMLKSGGRKGAKRNNNEDKTNPWKTNFRFKEKKRAPRSFYQKLSVTPGTFSWTTSSAFSFGSFECGSFDSLYTPQNHSCCSKKTQSTTTISCCSYSTLLQPAQPAKWKLKSGASRRFATETASCDLPTQHAPSSYCVHSSSQPLVPREFSALVFFRKQLAGNWPALSQTLEVKTLQPMQNLRRHSNPLLERSACPLRYNSTSMPWIR